MSAPAQPSDPSPLTDSAWAPNLLFYLASRFCAATAMTMLRAAIAWHVFALTNSAFHLGLIGLVQFIPALALTLVGGAVADTYERRRVIMLAQIVPLAARRGALRRHPRRRGDAAAALCDGLRHRRGQRLRQSGARRAAADAGAARSSFRAP